MITHAAVRRAMREHKGAHVFVDIAVPRNVSRPCTIDNVYVYNIDDLEQQVALGLQARQAEADAAEIVAAELADFGAWRRSLAVTPAIVALRTRTLDVLTAEASLRDPPPPPRPGRPRGAAGTHGKPASKLLHAPTTRLRERASSPEGADWVRAVTDVFGLPDVTSTPPPAGDRDPSADDEPVSAAKRLRLDPEEKAGAGDDQGRGG